MAVRNIMTKNELIKDFVNFYNSDKITPEKLKYNDMCSVMDEFGKYIQKRVETMGYDESIQIGNFVKIYILKREAKSYRNPNSGEEILKKEGRTVKAKVMPIITRVVKNAEEKDEE